MSQARVNELEAKAGPAGAEYMGHGLKVQVNKRHNTWFQEVTTSSRRPTTMGLGRTKRLSFANAQTVGSLFKDWARTHTMDECQAAAIRFRELAQTGETGRRVALTQLKSAWQEAAFGSSSDDRGGQESDRKLLASLQVTDVARGRGEGPEHERLKQYVKQTPSVLGLPRAIAAESEYRLASHDSVDVMFCHGGKMTCVEVKSKISDTSDIRRGLFQCIKYQAVTEAMLEAAGKEANVRSVLVLGLPLPSDLKATRRKLGIEVIENVNPS